MRAPLAGLLVLLLGAGRLRLPAAGEPLRVRCGGSAAVEWTILRGDTRLLVYRFDPRQYKPYVKELGTIRGDNLLRDAPHDHLHHHGLMYAIRVNGLNFWEESSGSGVQKVVASPAPELGARPDGRPQATLRQTLHWLAPQDAFLPDSPALALLVEQRTLVLTVDVAQEEVALQWSSQFEVGGKTNTVVLEGASYFGLGVRFLQELDAFAEPFHPDGAPDLSGTRQEVSPHDWCAVAFARPAAPATLAVFGHPANARGRPTFFTMKRPFAYLSATQALDREPQVHRAGERFRVDYLVTVYSAVRTAEFLNARAAEWRHTWP
jgi:hypothetical protein